jgi:phytoene desaturase
MFPVLFLGAMPNETPALYSLMNYADISLGTWYPMGGMYKFVEAFEKIAKEQGVQIKTDHEVLGFDYVDKTIVSAKTSHGTHDSDFFISGADYQHTDSKLLNGHANYSEKYWEKKTFAPSSLLFYVGFDKKVENVEHHTLFFDVSFKKHAEAIYDNPSWPEEPLFYASFPSKTDDSVAPEGCEAGIFLIPLAPGIEDTEELRDKYFLKIMSRFEEITQQKIKKNIIFRESFCVNDFIKDYNSYKGNAYGMANTLLQTAFLRPKLKSKKVENLYFTGQLTVPGPGVPPSFISCKLVAALIEKKN